MARKCKLTGKKPLAGNNVSHAKNHTKRWQKPNMQTKRIFDPELGRAVRLRLSTAAIRTVTRVGMSAYLRKRGMTLAQIQ